ncbi:unnamed protein product [Phytophthora lilii]|uniref:Unnamed protein product n=1 Tax=Phytophthora lilii TaxID=2077276 RepID=A0A9W6TXF0_9STRA|nr:unnamed protein product [Phytophthora lilii]
MPLRTRAGLQRDTCHFIVFTSLLATPMTQDTNDSLAAKFSLISTRSGVPSSFTTPPPSCQKPAYLDCFAVRLATFFIVQNPQRRSMLTRAANAATTMPASEVATNAAFLEEVSAFLDTSGLPIDLAVQADCTPLNEGDSFSNHGLPHDMDTDSSTSDASLHATKTKALSTKNKTGREKAMLRKQRYQRRLKNERETLREMEKKLSSRLTQLQQAVENRKHMRILQVTGTDGAWEDIAILERDRRLQAECEQARLIEAVNIQGSYLSNLRALLPTVKGFRHLKHRTRSSLSCFMARGDADNSSSL